MAPLRSRLTPRPAPARRPQQHRPAVEALEDRLTPSTGGLLDPTFGSGGQVASSFSNHYDSAQAVAVQPDGKIVVVGTTIASGSKTGDDFLVARYNANGTVDTSFGSGGYTATDFQKGLDAARAVALVPQPSGPPKILVVGQAAVQPNNEVALARYNPNGTLDTTFGKGGKVTTNLGNGLWGQGVVVDGAGRIIVAVSDSDILLRYTASGALDPTFGNKGEAHTGTSVTSYRGLALQSDGKVILATNTQSNSAFVMTRITANGAIDTTFGTGGTVITQPFPTNHVAFDGVALQSDGRIVVAGHEGGLDPDGVDRQGEYLLRYNADGSLDGTFASGGIAYLVNPAGLVTAGVGGVAVQSNGQIVAGTGLIDSSGTQQYFGALRVSASGALDTGYGNGGWASSALFVYGTSVQAMALQPDGRVIVAGYTRPSGTTYPTDVALCRFLPSAPQVGSFTASPSPVTSGSSTTLTASNISDGNPSSTVTQVTFYYIDGSGTQQVLGTGTQTSSGVWTLNYTVTLSPGLYTIYAQAQDSYNVLGDPIALALTVQ